MVDLLIFFKFSIMVNKGLFFCFYDFLQIWNPDKLMRRTYQITF